MTYINVETLIFLKVIPEQTSISESDYEMIHRNVLNENGSLVDLDMNDDSQVWTNFDLLHFTCISQLVENVGIALSKHRKQ